MAQYNGFTCDLCGNVISPEDRTKVTTRYEGRIVEGEYHQDRCPDCVQPPSGVTLKPLRRRRTRKAPESEAVGKHEG